MNLTPCDANYRTERFADHKTGCVGLTLLSTVKGETTTMGTITFWDAAGQFFLRLGGQEIPLQVVEKFIAEARQTISVS